MATAAFQLRLGLAMLGMMMFSSNALAQTAPACPSTLQQSANSAEVCIVQDFPPTLVNPCNNYELVLVTGSIAVDVLRSTQTNGFKVVFKTTSAGTGVGATGNRYAFSDTQNTTFSTTAAIDATITHNNHIVTQLPQNNFFIQALIHSTINPFGVPTVVVDSFSSGCQ
jgi:hypothetical protein